MLVVCLSTTNIFLRDLGNGRYCDAVKQSAVEHEGSFIREELIDVVDLQINTASDLVNASNFIKVFCNTRSLLIIVKYHIIIYHMASQTRGREKKFGVAKTFCILYKLLIIAYFDTAGYLTFATGRFQSQ